MDLRENKEYMLFVKALLSLKTEEECHAFLDDVMTRREILDISQRMMVAKLLSEQTIYTKIVEETGASTATISRVNRCYLYGSGGYKKVLSNLEEK